MSEKFLISRDHFESNLRRSLNVLKNEEDFQDVTLVTDDFHQVRANKLLLSASSEYFKTILLINKHSHPLLSGHCKIPMRPTAAQHIPRPIVDSFCSIFSQPETKHSWESLGLGILHTPPFLCSISGLPRAVQTSRGALSLSQNGTALRDSTNNSARQ